jgi:hypothetical protein
MKATDFTWLSLAIIVPLWVACSGGADGGCNPTNCQAMIALGIELPGMPQSEDLCVDGGASDAMNLSYCTRACDANGDGALVAAATSTAMHQLLALGVEPSIQTLEIAECVSQSPLDRGDAGLLALEGVNACAAPCDTACQSCQAGCDAASTSCAHACPEVDAGVCLECQYQCAQVQVRCDANCEG